METFADWEFYKLIFHGRADSETFERLAVGAAGYIDAVTFGRASAVPESDARYERIKCAVCAVVDADARYEAGGGVASESNDGISRTFVVGVSKTSTIEALRYRAAMTWLGRTGLMYQGGGY